MFISKNKLKTNRISSRKGFSLVELMVVIAIFAAIVAITTQGFLKHAIKFRLNGAAREIMSTFMWARMKAVNENNNYVVVFGAIGPFFTNNTIFVYDDNENDFDPQNIDDSELVRKLVISDEYEGVGFGGYKKIDNADLGDGKYARFGATGSGTKPVRTTFYPTGRTSQLGTVYIMTSEDLAENDKQAPIRAVTISSAGRIRIRSYSGTTWD